jgi:hypothetical protein
VFEELFADDFVDHTPQPGTTPDKDGVRVLYKRLRAAFPDFRLRDSLAGGRRRPRDDVQDLSRYPPRRVPRCQWNRPCSDLQIAQ